MWNKLRLPDPASWSLKWNGTIHVNQRAKLPNRETCKSGKNLCAPYYMATAEEKQIDMHFENGITNVFLWESPRG